MKLSGINIKLERTNRKKTLSIFIERDGSIRVLAPKTTSKKVIESTVKAKEFQIFTKLAKWKELNQGKVHRKFVNGQSFLYLGRNYRLSIVKNLNEPVILKGGYLLLNNTCANNVECVFEDFYRERAKQKINERIKIIQEKFRLKPSSVKVMNLKNRWASCSSKNRLNFHWKCVMAPISVLDYIITHEMVHLKYPNHSTEFWNELDKKMPNFRESEQWLKTNGVKMSL